MLNGVCKVQIQSGKAVAANCENAYDFRISAAAKISKQKACTNVPIECLVCNDVHWKYNMHRHLQERHPSWETNIAPSRNLHEFRNRITITNEEEAKLGIPEEYQGRSVVAEAAYDARRSQHLPSTRNVHGDSPRRPRHAHFRDTTPLPFSLPYNISQASIMMPALHDSDVFH